MQIFQFFKTPAARTHDIELKIDILILKPLIHILWIFQILRMKPREVVLRRNFGGVVHDMQIACHTSVTVKLKHRNAARSLEFGHAFLGFCCFSSLPALFSKPDSVFYYCWYVLFARLENLLCTTTAMLCSWGLQLFTPCQKWGILSLILEGCYLLQNKTHRQHYIACNSYVEYF